MNIKIIVLLLSAMLCTQQQYGMEKKEEKENFDATFVNANNSRTALSQQVQSAEQQKVEKQRAEEKAKQQEIADRLKKHQEYFGINPSTIRSGKKGSH
jgi:uncharacterized protein YlxW (UPF0749 family)